MDGKKLRYRLAFFVLTTLIYMLMELRCDPPIWALRPKYYATAAVFAVHPRLAHSRRAEASSDYVGELFLGCQNEPRRIAYIDYLRILAALLIIPVHVLESAYALLLPHTFIRDVIAVSTGLGLSYDLLFVVLSGALLLGGKKESALEFYSRRFVRALIPCLAYYLSYLFYVEGISALSPGNRGGLPQSFLSNDGGQTPHLWLVYIILMFYTVAPFFRIMLKHMIELMLEALTAIIIILHFIYTYGLLVRVEFAASALLAPWDSIFLLGCCCTTQSAMKHYWPFAIVSLLSGLTMATAVMASESLGPLAYDNAPPQIFFTCAVFLSFRKHGDSLFARIPILLSAVGGYSFSILLARWLVLHRTVDDVFGINGLSFGIAGGISISFLFALIISLAPAFLYNDTVVLCMNRAYRTLFSILGCVRRRP